MNKFFPIALLAVLILGCKGGETTAATTGGGSTTALAGQIYNFKFSPTQGEKYRYSMKVVSQGRTVEQGFTIACEKAEGGKFTMVTSIDTFKMDGKDVPASVFQSLKNMKSTAIMDSTGKTLESKTEGAPGGVSADTPTPSLPTKPVKIGDTWEGTAKIGGQEVKYSYKLTGVGNEDGKEVATIEAMTSNIPGGGSLDGPMVLKVELATGMPYSMTMKSKSKDPSGNDVSATMEMTRI